MNAPSPLVAPVLTGHSRATAVRSGTTALTYADLQGEIAAGCDALRRAGIGPGCRVALALPKSLNALRVILATLAAGAAYVPLNHRLTPAALATILEDLRPDLLIAAPGALAGQAERLPGLQITPHLDTTPERLPGVAVQHDQPPDLAAILFTSGSTGTPKGIMLSHDNIGCFATWAAREFALGAADQVASHAPFHFDLSTFDIFATLATGATLHLLDDADAAFPGAVRRFIADAGITTWYSVPTALAQLQSRGALAGLSSLRQVLFAGEVFPTPVLRQAMAALPAAGVANLFGPTETNVCTFHRLASPPHDDTPIPIGIPCPHAGITLSADGEIGVTGPGVMLGYWRQPALTTASRIDGRPDSYRTGDFATRRPDGALMFNGRRDHLVKLRGHRVELLALEAVLQAHPAIAEAVAVVTGERLAVAIIERSPIDDAALRNVIAACLVPAYQPGSIIRLNTMPRSSNGKADRGALRVLAAGA